MSSAPQLPAGPDRDDRGYGITERMQRLLRAMLRNLWILLCDVPRIAADPFIRFAEYKPRRDRVIEMYAASEGNNFWVERLQDKVIVEVPKYPLVTVFQRVLLAFLGVVAFLAGPILYHYAANPSITYHQYHQRFETASRNDYLQAMEILQLAGTLGWALLWIASALLIYLAATSKKGFFFSIKMEPLKDPEGNINGRTYTIMRHWRKIHWKCGSIRLGPLIHEAKAKSLYFRGRYLRYNDLYLLDASGDVIQVLDGIPAKELEGLEELINWLIPLTQGNSYELSQLLVTRHPARPELLYGEVVVDEPRPSFWGKKAKDKRDSRRRWNRE